MPKPNKRRCQCHADQLIEQVYRVTTSTCGATLSRPCDANALAPGWPGFGLNNSPALVGGGTGVSGELTVQAFEAQWLPGARAYLEDNL